eukprot:c16259_g1_i3.p1 GENE.c16259_g1_i3~~c16259_g1_i3.p1  ORF type:complete len:143 (+),score=35.17 c16259_g1_i3:295-723(+)
MSMLQRMCDTQLGFTPIHCAASHGRLGIVRILIQGRANVNSTTLAGQTPLMFAASSNSLVVMQQLMVSGAMISIKTQGGHTARTIAQHVGYDQAVGVIDLEIRRRLRAFLLGTSQRKRNHTVSSLPVDVLELIVEKACFDCL